jgi:parvulin-like peptidyl-prolyl isomerase
LYYLLVGVADVEIYRKHADNRFTRAIEHVFPYPAAVVGSQVIPLSRFRLEVDARVTYSQRHQLTASKQDIESLVINQLIDKAMYAQAIASYKVTVSSQDVDASMQGIDTQIGGQDKLIAFIHDNYGSTVTLNDFRQWVNESLVESAIQHQILQRAEVDHILISVPATATADEVEAARQKALSVKALITDPSTFATVAQQYSEDISSRDKGGALGITVRGDDAPVISTDFQNAIFSLPLNTVSDPVRSSFGWHLIMVTSRDGSVQESMKQFTADLTAKDKPHALIGL